MFELLNCSSNPLIDPTDQLTDLPTDRFSTLYKRRVKRHHFISILKNTSEMTGKKMYKVGGRDVYLTVAPYKGVTKINIRHYNKNEIGDLYPTSRGIALNIDEYMELKKKIKKIDGLVREVEEKRTTLTKSAPPKRKQSPPRLSDTSDSDSSDCEEIKKIKKEKSPRIEL